MRKTEIMKSKAIYIVLIKAMTGLGRFSRKLFGYEYTHIAVSLTDELCDFVTFSRRRHYTPFDAGFMHEKREHYAFGKYDSAQVKVFKIPVTEDIYNRIVNFVNEVENDSDYVFNFYSMLTMPVIHGFKIYKSYNCMSFVGRILELTGEISMDRKYYRYSIKEFDRLLEGFENSTFNLKKSSDDIDYMSKAGIFKNIGQYIVLNAILTYRLIFKSMVKF